MTRKLEFRRKLTEIKLKTQDSPTLTRKPITVDKNTRQLKLKEYFDKNQDKNPTQTHKPLTPKPKNKQDKKPEIPVLTRKRKFEEEKNLKCEGKEILKRMNTGKNDRQEQKFEKNASKGFENVSKITNILCYSNSRVDHDSFVRKVLSALQVKS